ncbi:MAG: MerR family transcriptional regulator [Burkholderiaceae bacterium]|jgi:MerR family copper efflux transcriptional regulator
MKIGELAAATGIATSAIRFYEQSGLLPAVQRAGNGYRSYSEGAVERLRFIQVAQALGFTLDALRSLFVTTEAFSKAQLQDELLQALETRLGEIDHMLGTLRTQRKDLLALREQMVATWATGVCVDPTDVELSPAETAPPAPRARRVARAAAPAQTAAPGPADRAQRR